MSQVISFEYCQARKAWAKFKKFMLEKHKVVINSNAIKGVTPDARGSLRIAKILQDEIISNELKGYRIPREFYKQCADLMLYL